MLPKNKEFSLKSIKGHQNQVNIHYIHPPCAAQNIPGSASLEMVIEAKNEIIKAKADIILMQKERIEQLQEEVYKLKYILKTEPS